VQPVLDRYCISCHGLGKVEKNVNLLSLPYGKYDVDHGKTYSVAHQSLIDSGLVKVAWSWAESTSSKPNDYFAGGGNLARMLLAGHPDKDGNRRVELDRESFQRMVDWMDLNAQFYGDYSHNRLEWQQPIPEAEQALRSAIAARFGEELAAQPYAALVNMAMPSESRVLMAPLPVAKGGWGQVAKGAFSGKDDPAWQAMLKLVENSYTKPKYRDVAGTCGHDEKCACGSCWVRKANAERQQAAGAAESDASAETAAVTRQPRR
jgi:hypothetical protein